MAKQYSLKDISVITLKRITVDDDLREFIEKVNFNFDQILSVLDNRFYDEVSKNVLKLIANGKYLQYLTNKPSDSVQWIGKPGRTGKPGTGKNGKDGHSIYVSKAEIPQDGIADNFKYKEGDVVLDKSGYIYVITKKNDKLYYTLQFRLSTGSGSGSGSQSANGIITTEDKYVANNGIADHWILYDVDNTSYGSNNVILATADDTFVQLYRLTIGAEKAINENNGTLNLVNIPSFRSSAVDETFSPQILLKYRKNYQSALLPDVSAHIRYFDVYDSTLENVEHQQLDMWTSANTGVSVQSFAGKSKENSVIFNARKVRFIGNRDVVPTIFSKPELIVRVHEKVGNQITKDNDNDLSSYNQSYVAIYTNENLLINAAKELRIYTVGNLILSGSAIQLHGEIDVNGVLRIDHIEHTSRGNEIVIGGKLHVSNAALSLDDNYELITNKISNKGNITITAQTVDISDEASIGGQLRVNSILPKSGQFVTISQVAITSNSTIAGKIIYHAGNLNLLSIPFAAQQYNATSTGYLIDSKKIMFTTNNVLTIGNSTLNNVNVVSRNGLTVNGDKVITTSVYIDSTQNIVKELEKKADETELILNVKDIIGVPNKVLLGQHGTFLNYETLGFPTKKGNHSDYVLAGDYKWLEIQSIPFLRNSSTNVEKGVLGFLDKNELQYLSLEQLLDTNSHKVADSNHIQVVNVNRDGKLQITNVLQVTNPNNAGDDLILSYDKSSQSAVWKENNPLPKENKKPGRVLVLGENSKPEWGNDYMHYRFFWNTKTNKLDRIDPSQIDWEHWIGMGEFGDLRNKISNFSGRATLHNESQYTNYIGNLNGQFRSFGLPKEILETEIDHIRNLSTEASESIIDNYGMDAINYFYKSASDIIPALRYIVSVVGNIVTVYFWKPQHGTSSEESYRLIGISRGDPNNGFHRAIYSVCYPGKMYIPSYLADYDNHGISYGAYGAVNEFGQNSFQLPSEASRHINLYLNCIPFDEWFRYNVARDYYSHLNDQVVDKVTKLLKDKNFIHKNRVVTLGLGLDNSEAAGLNHYIGNPNFYFKNFGTLNQVSWILSNPISKEHYNFEE